MVSRSGRFVIVFNGEIYNHGELASIFGLPERRTGTDTEVLLELIERIGIEGALRRANGMWAFVLFDRHARVVWISRDRAGIKPLYICRLAGEVIIASEIKTILATSRRSFAIDRPVARRFLYQSLQAIDERTFVDGIEALPAASYARIWWAGKGVCISPAISFWSAEPKGDDVYAGSTADYVDECKALIEDACRLRLRADVGVGVALSGGLDSSILTAIAAGERCRGAAVTAISAVSPGDSSDESRYSRAVVEWLGLQSLTVNTGEQSEETLVNAFRWATAAHDAPLASFAPLFYYLMMREISQTDVKVVLSGQGADELFCGYRKYQFFHIQDLVKRGRFPQAALASLMAAWNGRLLGQLDFAEARRYLPWSVSTRRPALDQDRVDIGLGTSGLRSRQWADFRSLSVPALLHYEDRMSMAFGREVRVPFLDHRLVEHAMAGPDPYKIRRGWTKYTLRRAFQRQLPPRVIWRKDKKGFSNPQDRLLKTVFRGHLSRLLCDPGGPVFLGDLADYDAYKKLVDQYLAGNSRIWFREVFAPVAFNEWMRVQDNISL